MQTRTRSIALLAIAAATLSGSAVVRATVPCGIHCYCPSDMAIDFFPDYVYYGLPTNMRFLLLGEIRADSIELYPIDSPGDGIAFDTTEVAGLPGSYWVLPSELLAPTTTYQITWSRTDGEPMMRQVSTGESPDHQAPIAVDGPHAQLPPDEEICDAYIGARFQALYDDPDGGEAILVRIDVRRGDGAANVLYVEVGAFYGDLSEVVGDSGTDCLGSLAGAQVGEVIDATLTPMDAAGNEGEPVVITGIGLAAGQAASKVTGCCGCSAAGGRAPALELALFFLLSLWVIRRRRST